MDIRDSGTTVPGRMFLKRPRRWFTPEYRVAAAHRVIDRESACRRGWDIAFLKKPQRTLRRSIEGEPETNNNEGTHTGRM